ncbi:hypothetical protein BR10RB9215_C20014 [Brucella sp. 10RB9215]|nr:hypothetical protein BR10RB9215_C20014 [Brucella sp. 10RB9215]
MVGHQMPFLNPTFLAAGKIVEYASKQSSEMPRKCFFAVFGVNTTWYLHSHVV